MFSFSVVMHLTYYNQLHVSSFFSLQFRPTSFQIKISFTIYVLRLLLDKRKCEPNIKVLDRDEYMEWKVWCPIIN